jgi:hypothetical protein
MTARATHLLVETRPEFLLAEVLFRRQLEGGLATLEECSSPSGAISSGMSYLLTTWDPVAVLLITRSEDPREVAEVKGATTRMLARCSLDGWVAGFAIPNLEAWALTDPRLKPALDANPPPVSNYVTRAYRLHELAKAQPFDPTNLRRQNADFRRIEEFIDRGGNREVPPGAAAPLVVEWF